MYHQCVVVNANSSPIPGKLDCFLITVFVHCGKLFSTGLEGCLCERLDEHNMKQVSRLVRLCYKPVELPNAQICRLAHWQMLTISNSHITGMYAYISGWDAYAQIEWYYWMQDIYNPRENFVTSHQLCLQTERQSASLFSHVHACALLKS